MRVDVTKCAACGRTHLGMLVHEAEGKKHIMCPKIKAYVIVEVDESAPPPSDPQEDPELEAHRQRLKMLMKEAIAPLMENIRESEARLVAREKEIDARDEAWKGEVGRRRDLELAEARKRFRVSLAAEVFPIAHDPETAMSLADRLIKIGGVTETRVEMSVCLDNAEIAELTLDGIRKLCFERCPKLKDLNPGSDYTEQYFDVLCGADSVIAVFKKEER